MKLERLTCRQRVALLCDYLDKALPPRRRRLIARHKRGCKPCSALLADLERTAAALRKLNRGKTPSSSRRRLRAALAKLAA